MVSRYSHGITYFRPKVRNTWGILWLLSLHLHCEKESTPRQKFATLFHIVRLLSEDFCYSFQRLLVYQFYLQIMQRKWECSSKNDSLICALNDFVFRLLVNIFRIPLQKKYLSRRPSGKVIREYCLKFCSRFKFLWNLEKFEILVDQWRWATKLMPQAEDFQLFAKRHTLAWFLFFIFYSVWYLWLDHFFELNIILK